MEVQGLDLLLCSQACATPLGNDGTWLALSLISWRDCRRSGEQRPEGRSETPNRPMSPWRAGGVDMRWRPIRRARGWSLFVSAGLFGNGTAMTRLLLAQPANTIRHGLHATNCTYCHAMFRVLESSLLLIGARTSAAARENVLLLETDDAWSEHLKCYGSW